ncbi:MAG: ABC transporter permease [Acidimicrobiia bacterium]
MDGLDSVLVLGASLTLIAVAVVISLVLRLGIERSIVWASIRAAVQLGVVGYLLVFILGTRWEAVLAGIWVVAMVAIAGGVTARRAGSWSVFGAGVIAIGSATALSLIVVFGFNVLPFEPIQVIVVAGITIGNALTGTVVAADQVRVRLVDDAARVEGLLALGLDARQAARFVVREAARVALLPHIERTKAVGLVALPGAMAGLLIAGVDPIDAVVIQLVVMLLVLGTVAVSCAVIAVMTARAFFTPDQRLVA